MENLKQQITDLLWKHSETAYGKGSCGELGDSHESIESCYFSDVADEVATIIEANFEPKKCMPDGLNSKEEHEEYLKAIGFEKYVKNLQHFKDTTIGLYAFDKDINKIFEDIPSKEDCKTVVESHFIQQLEYLKSIIFKIN